MVNFFVRRYRGLDLDSHALRSAVMEGIRKASLQFDPGRGVKFSFYAGNKVRAEVQAALENKLKEHLGSTFLAKLALNIGRLERSYLSKTGQYPTDSQVAETLGATLKSVAEVRRLRAEMPVSLYSPKGQNGTLRLIDCIPDAAVITPLEEILQREAQNKFEEALDSLPPRQGFVLRAHFGIGDEDEQTLEETGVSLGNRERGKPLTKQRVEQIEIKALERLRENYPELADQL